MDRAKMREIIQAHFDRGDYTGLFEALYAEAKESPSDIPWADMRPNHQLVHWLNKRDRAQPGNRALVVGCGLGDDAEYLAGQGFRVTAFDISSTAIALCKARFPQTQVNYVTANLLDLPPELSGQFDFVVEIYTVQAMTPRLRSEAFSGLAQTLAPDGLLLIIARGREDGEDRGNMPWPLSRSELAELEPLGLRQETFENYFDDEEALVRRFRATYRKPA